MSAGDLVLREVAPADWPALAAGFADLTFEQGLPYAQAAAARIGARARFVALDGPAGRPTAAAAIRLKTVPGLGRGIAWAPSAPLIRPLEGDPAPLADVLAALRAGIAGREGHLLRLRLAGIAGQDPAAVRPAALAAGFRPSDRAPVYRSLAIDLAPDAETLMKRLNGKWRTDLRYALKSDLGLEAGDGPGLRARFMALFDEVQGAKGFSPEIRPEFHFALAGPDYPLEILIATRDGADLAGIVVGWTGQGAVYLFGATAPAGRKLRAGYFLTWEGIGRARDRGLAWYDLGGVDAKANPDVARFKERMNGTPLCAEVFEALPGGLGRLVPALESLHGRLKRRTSGQEAG